MHISSRFDSPILPATGVNSTRAGDGTEDAAQPSLTSGFGTVMEQEEDIQSTTAGYLGANGSRQMDELDRVLRHQQSRLGANIALLEQRYETLPYPARFRAPIPRGARLSRARRAPAVVEAAADLHCLVTQHLDLVRNIQILIAQRPDGQRGELILSEVARNHEDMASALIALLAEHAAVGDSILPPVTAAVGLSVTEAVWENEGGPTSPKAGSR